MLIDTKNDILATGQTHAARGLLRWLAEKLAEVSGVGLVTIRRAEAKDGPLQMRRPYVDTIRRALKAASIRFTEDGCVCPPVTEQ